MLKYKKHIAIALGVLAMAPMLAQAAWDCCVLSLACLEVTMLDPACILFYAVCRGFGGTGC